MKYEQNNSQLKMNNNITIRQYEQKIEQNKYEHTMIFNMNKTKVN